MTWSYDASNLDTTTEAGKVNVIRFLIGDTDERDEQLQDEEITFALSQKPNVYSAASFLALSLASKYARLVDTELDDSMTAKYSQQYDHYTDIARSMKEQAASNSGGFNIVAGGVKRATVGIVRKDPTRVKSKFYPGKFSYPDGS